MTEQELLECIERAARTGAIILNLSFKNLSALPPEIGQLTNLTTLDLHSNHLSILPPEIGRLANLKPQYLSDNPLGSLPSAIQKYLDNPPYGVSNYYPSCFQDKQIHVDKINFRKVTGMCELRLFGISALL